MTYFDEIPIRKRISNTEWKEIKAIHKNRCVICDETDKSCGGLERAHLKADSRGGTQVVPMCATCHKKYDGGKLTLTKLKRIGLTPEMYKKVTPSNKKNRDWLWD